MANCQIIDGKKIAAEHCLKIKNSVEILKTKHNLIPGLAVMLVGQNPASVLYVNNKLKKAKEIGINIFEHNFSEHVSAKILTAKIEHLNNDHRVHGILLQLPLPDHLNSHEIVNQIETEKDVDGFTIRSIGLLNSWKDCLEPCTPKGIIILLKRIFGPDLSGKKAVVVGRSAIVGRPMIAMLIRENCTVTAVHSKSVNVAEECSQAEILISATGSPNMIKSSWVKKGACVIDVGIIRNEEGKLCGDVVFDEAKEVAGYLTPVPGGVGPMTVACMLENTIKAACFQKKIPFESLGLTCYE